MKKTIYLRVTNLDEGVTAPDLKKLFSPIGKVLRVSIIEPVQAGKAMWEGYLEMANQSAAQRAIEELDDTTFNNRLITVQWLSTQSFEQAVDWP